jgi:hypothetical protein
MPRIIWLSAIALIFSACGGQKKENPILLEAADTHVEAVRIEQEIRPRIEELAQLKNQLSIQGRELTPAEQAFIEDVDRLLGGLAHWDENVVEVPGYEHHGHDHEDDHEHEHHHHRAAPPNMSPEDILFVQRELRDTLMAMRRAMEAAWIRAAEITRDSL